MNPISVEALKRRALSMGGKLEVDGRAFNAARVQGGTLPAKKAAPTAPPPPAEPSKDERTLSAIEQMAQIQTQVLQAMRSNTAQAPAVKHWHFKINRTPKGDLESIEAISKE